MMEKQLRFRNFQLLLYILCLGCLDVICMS